MNTKIKNTIKLPHYPLAIEDLANEKGVDFLKVMNNRIDRALQFLDERDYTYIDDRTNVYSTINEHHYQQSTEKFIYIDRGDRNNLSFRPAIRPYYFGNPLEIVYCFIRAGIWAHYDDQSCPAIVIDLARTAIYLQDVSFEHSTHFAYFDIENEFEPTFCVVEWESEGKVKLHSFTYSNHDVRDIFDLDDINSFSDTQYSMKNTEFMNPLDEALLISDAIRYYGVINFSQTAHEFDAEKLEDDLISQGVFGVTPYDHY